MAVTGRAAPAPAKRARPPFSLRQADGSWPRCVALAPVTLDRPGDLDPGGDGELEEDVAKVRLDGLAAEEQLACDLRVRLAVGDEHRDLELALGQRLDPALSGSRATACLGTRPEAAQ